jgi:uncharacterized coiled-coil protein SlyX
MEKRLITLEVLVNEQLKSIDRLDQSISDLRKDFDRKFIWMLSSQSAAMLAIIGLLAKIGNIF